MPCTIKRVAAAAIYAEPTDGMWTIPRRDKPPLLVATNGDTARVAEEPERVPIERAPPARIPFVFSGGTSHVVPSQPWIGWAPA